MLYAKVKYITFLINIYPTRIFLFRNKSTFGTIESIFLSYLEEHWHLSAFSLTFHCTTYCFEQDGVASLAPSREFLEQELLLFLCLLHMLPCILPVHEITNCFSLNWLKQRCLTITEFLWLYPAHNFRLLEIARKLSLL